MILVSTPKVKSQSGQRSKSCLSNNSNSTEANLTKLHRKIQHSEKMCRAQELGSYAVRDQIVPKANLIKLQSKIKHNEKMCHTHDFWFLRPSSRSKSGQRPKLCVSNNSKNY